MHQSLPFCVIPSHCRIGLARVGACLRPSVFSLVLLQKKRNTALNMT